MVAFGFVMRLEEGTSYQEQSTANCLNSSDVWSAQVELLPGIKPFLKPLTLMLPLGRRSHSSYSVRDLG